MMVEAEATEDSICDHRRRRHEADRRGRRRGPRSRQAVHRRAVPRPGRAREVAASRRRVPVFLDYSAEVFEASRPSFGRARGALTIADKQERETRLTRSRTRSGRTREQFEISSTRSARPTARYQEARAPARPARQGADRRSRPGRHPHALGRGRGHPAGARSALFQRRETRSWRHHPEHAGPRAEARHAEPNRTWRYVTNCVAYPAENRHQGPSAEAPRGSSRRLGPTRRPPVEYGPGRDELARTLRRSDWGSACRASARGPALFRVVTPRIWVSPRWNSAERGNPRDDLDLAESVRVSARPPTVIRTLSRRTRWRRASW